MRRFLFAALWLCLLSMITRADPARVAFLDVWDRSMPQLHDACQDAGLNASFYRTPQFTKLTEAEIGAFSVVLVLNIDDTESPKLTGLLKNAAAANPKQLVIPLDTRSSHVDLEKAGLLKKDDAVVSYWKPNGTTNIRRMIAYVENTYLGVPRKVEPPVMIPESGFYDPSQEEAFETIDAYRAFKKSKGRWQDGQPSAVMVIQQSFWITRDLKVVDAQITALEKAGLNAVVIFGDHGDKVGQLVASSKPDVLIEDRHGSTWESNAILKQLDVPYLRPISMLGSTVAEWQANPMGLTPKDIGMFMSLQESWGTIEPVVVGGLKANIQGFRLHEPIPERVETFAARAARWAALHAKKNAEKKLALIYYNKSLGQDDFMRGSPTGAFLDGPESMVRFLPEMQKAGYAVKDLPATSAELIDRIRHGGRNLGPWAQGDLEKQADEADPVLVPLSTYKRWFEERLSPESQKAVIEKHGPPPGKLMVVQRNGEPQIVLPRLKLGNVILMPQPERAEKQDDKLLHSRDLPPPHNYLAFYWWLDREYKADAIVHWGTHGSLELLPGKETGLSADSWSDICVGKLPVIDLWITDNLGESTLARRRSYALLSDHLPPATVGAGLGDKFKNLHEEIHKFNTLDKNLLREEFRKNITKLAEAEHLDETASPGRKLGQEPLDDAAIRKLDDHLHELYEAQTPVRLHVLGEPPLEQDRMPYLVSILGKDFLDHYAKSIGETESVRDGHQQELRDKAAAFLTESLKEVSSGKPVPPGLEKDVELARTTLAKLMNGRVEVDGLLHALAGGYLEAGPGPEPIRNPATLPTGRNLYSLNPEEIPTRPAWEVARQLVGQLLATRKPEKIGIDLNGMDTMRDFGVMEGQILFLLGVKPVWNSANQVIDVELIPAEELGRPRVDVFIAMGGMYKENFPSRVKLLDKAVKLAAEAKETDNPVRAHSDAMRSRLAGKGFTAEDAGKFSVARIFGTKPGNVSGTNILYLVPRSGVWDNDDQITSVYMDNMSYVYSGDAWGRKVDGLYEEAMQGTDTLLRVWASNMTSQLSNHHAYEYLGGLSMAVKKVTGKEPAAFISDVRDPNGARIRDFNEVLAANFQAELLNRKWIEGMKGNGYAGAGHISELVKNTFGWSVTRPGSVGQGTWNDIYETYIRDREKLDMDKFFEEVSPHALQEIAATLLESARKGVWEATPEQIAELARVYGESVAKHGESGGLVGGGNEHLRDYASQSLVSTGGARGAELAQALKEKAAESAAAPGPDKVAGQKLEQVKQTPESQVKPQPQPPAPRPIWEYAALAACVLLLIGGFAFKSGMP
ncbi:cobaltochelatase subunit CobN [Haloferula sp. BvORR071]|uniref:cobaltochelatase subunit CobN n=1 Tax=Haloferula sp. BvORR071 TaxID=1396141 RepID=UPI0009DCCB23|nr:cobaltochelatase subunit CobN [Haloferula sp. BvORR071]